MGKRGMALTLDAMLAIMVMSMLFLVILENLDRQVFGGVQRVSEERLVMNAVQIADLILKTRDENVLHPGAAIWLENEKRVQENVLDLSLLREKEWGRMGRGRNIGTISLTDQKGNRETIFRAGRGMHCIEVERLVLIPGLLGHEKKKLGVTVCEEG